MGAQGARAPADSFEEKEKRKKAGLVSLRKVLAADKPSGVANDGRTEVGGAATSTNRNFAPRSAWPEGKFTITYPKGYDPALGKFVAGGADGGGSGAARVVVQKLPAAERARLEEEARAVAEAAARARAEATDALNLDEEYLERVRARDELAKSRRRRSATAATTTTTMSTTMLTTTPGAKPAPDPALLAEVGVDGAYMAALAEQEEKRRKVREAARSRRRRRRRRRRLCGSPRCSPFGNPTRDGGGTPARTRTERERRSSANWSRRRAKPPRRRPPSPSTTRESKAG